MHWWRFWWNCVNRSCFEQSFRSFLIICASSMRLSCTCAYIFPLVYNEVWFLILKMTCKYCFLYIIHSIDLTWACTYTYKKHFTTNIVRNIFARSSLCFLTPLLFALYIIILNPWLVGRAFFFSLVVNEVPCRCCVYWIVMWLQPRVVHRRMSERTPSAPAP